MEQEELYRDELCANEPRAQYRPDEHPGAHVIIDSAPFNTGGELWSWMNPWWGHPAVVLPFLETRLYLQGLQGIPGAEGAAGKPGTQVPILHSVLG